MNEQERITLSVVQQKLAKKEARIRSLQEEIHSLEEDCKELRGVIRQLQESESNGIAIDKTKGSSFAVPQSIKDAIAVKDGLLSVIQQEQTLENANFPYEKIKGMSQARATIAIARHFGGVIRTKVLAKILIQAGVLRRTKNASSMASRLIIESDRFEKISDGLYRLKNFEPGSFPSGVSPHAIQ